VWEIHDVELDPPPLGEVLVKKATPASATPTTSAPGWTHTIERATQLKIEAVPLAAARASGPPGLAQALADRTNMDLRCRVSAQVAARWKRVELGSVPDAWRTACTVPVVALVLPASKT
jgi:hypothetical protein